MGLGKDLKSAFGFAYGVLAGVPPREGKTHVSTVFVGAKEDIVCGTCQDSGLVGHPPYEQECPACKDNCKTCGGRGVVGNPGHELACPACRQVEP